LLPTIVRRTCVPPTRTGPGVTVAIVGPVEKQNTALHDVKSNASERKAAHASKRPGLNKAPGMAEFP
jgi:hypothetical protein